MTTPLTPADLDRIEAAAKAATPGPLGDVWLASLGWKGISYEKRVDVDACSEWGATEGGG